MARAGALFLACAFTSLIASIALTVAACAVSHAQEASGAISGFGLSNDVSGELAVAWDMPSPAPTDYRVDWARSDEEFRSYKVDEGHLYPQGTVTRVSISGLVPGVEYKVRVRARYAGWSGPWSEASLTVSAEPTVAVTVGSQTALGSPTVADASAATTTLTISWSAPADGGSPISSYELRYIESGASERSDERWTLQRGLAAGAQLGTVLTGLTDGVSYDVQVRAVNEDGAGPWSASSSNRTRDHGDTRGEATPLALESSVPGRINQPGDQDVFVIVTPRTALLTVSGSGAANIQGSLTTSEGDVLVSSSGSLLNAPRQFSLDATVEAGAYYLTVSHALGGTGSYMLQAQTRVASQSRTALDPDPDDATVIELDSYAEGTFHSLNGAVQSPVLFRFTLEQATEVWMHSSHSGLIPGPIGELMTDQGVRIDFNEYSYHWSILSEFGMRQSLAAGTYFIKVTRHWTSDFGSFRVYVRTVTEPGSTAATATPLPFHTIKTGRIASATDQDFFQLTLDSRRNVLILATAFEENTPLDIKVFDGDTQLDLFTAEQAHHSAFYRTIAGYVRDWLDAGTYTIRVSAPEGSAGAAYIIESTPDDIYAAGVTKCLQKAMQDNAQSTEESVDPLSGCQWHLNNTGQYGEGPGFDINVAGVWATTKGEGINIAVIDSDLQADHYDLDDNIDLDLSHNLDSLEDSRLLRFGSLGTIYTGVIAAEHNDIGVRGVAPESTILFNGGIHWKEEENTESELVAAILRNSDVVAVSYNGWGGAEDDNVRRASAEWQAALDFGVTKGFGGKGIFYVFTGGFHLDYADDANLNGRSNSYAATTVCGVGYNDKRLKFGNRGATLWLCAPADHIATTNYGNRYLFERYGPAYATAIVSGVAALLRATNEDLTWRDVKLILAASARWNDQSSNSWKSGPAKYGATGNYRFSHDYGFGVVDAGAAVALANTWTKLPTMKTFEASSRDVRQVVPDAPSSCCFGPTVTSKVTIDPYVEFVEFVELHIEFDHPSFRDVKIELISPSGAVSTILPAAHSTRINTRFYPHALRSSVRFGSARHLGENPAGEWTLRLADRYHERSGDLVSWRLKIYGHGDLPGRPGVTSAVAGMTTLTIGWVAPEETGSGAVTSYDLRYIRSQATDKSDDNWTEVIGAGASDTDTYQMTNLGPGARYDVQVRAVTGRGAGPWSLTYEAHPMLELPWAPTNVELRPRHLGLGVFWQPPAEDGGADVSRYDLRYIPTEATDKADANWTPVAAWSTGDGELRYNIPSLINGTPYDVQLQAHTSVGASPWSAVVAAEPRLLNVDAAFAPTETGLREVVENAPSGTAVGEPIVAVDPDDDVLEFSLAETDSSHFEIDPATGQIQTAAPLDHEVQDSYSLTVYVRDNKNHSDERDTTIDAQIEVAVSVVDANDPHLVTGRESYTVDEHGSLLIGQYEAVDIEQSPMTWSLSGHDESAFEIDEHGWLSFASERNFEVSTDSGRDNIYDVNVIASDDGSYGHSLSASLAVRVTVRNVEELPIIHGPSELTVDEDGPILVTKYYAVDPERERNPRFSVTGGVDGNSFTLKRSSTWRRIGQEWWQEWWLYWQIGAPSFEQEIRGDTNGDNIYETKFQVWAGSGNPPAIKFIRITVADINEEADLTLSSPQPLISIPYTATHDDPDRIISRSWSWHRSQNRDDWNVIDGATSSTYTPGAADINHYLRATTTYEDTHGAGKVKESVSRRVVKRTAQDNDPPRFTDDGLTLRFVAENSSHETVVGAEVEATDPNRDDLVYSLVSTFNDRFEIDSETGQILVGRAANLDHETTDEYLLMVEATDPGTLKDTITVTIRITDVDEQPATEPDEATTDEDVPVEIDVLANDFDPEGDPLRVSIHRDPRNGTVQVLSDNKLRVTPNLHASGRMTFQYRVSDGKMESIEWVTVEVREINDPPSFAEPTIELEVQQGSRGGTLVGQELHANDPDHQEGELVYTLSGSADFVIERETAQISVAPGAVMDDTVQEIYSLVVRVQDPDGDFARATITVQVVEQLTLTTNRGTGGGGGGGGGGPTPSEVDFEWTVTRDIEGLDGGNDRATGVWSDGTTLWVADNADGAGDAVYAYDRESGERVEEREFTLAETNRAPRGFWSDGETVWVSDSGRERLFAYRLADGERLEEREFELPRENRDARGIWSDEKTMWVLDGRADALFAYDFESSALLGEYALADANGDPRGIWSDGVTVWVSDHGAKRLFAYRLPVLPDEEADSGEEDAGDDRELERVSDEEFSKLSRAGNNSPRGLWSDGDVMYVADESDDRVYSYNMPDAIDARLASLTLSGVDIGEFDPGRPAYEAVVADGVTETTVEAGAMQPRTDIAIDPPDADGDDANGHQVALQDLGEVTVTATSQDGSRTKTYRVRFPETGWDAARDPWPHCLRGAVSEGFSLVVYEGGSIAELVTCAESRDIVTLYVLHEGVYLSYILGAPDFVNAGFVGLFPDGLPPITPLIAGNNGPPSADPFADLDGVGQQPWPECLRGDIAAGFSLVVHEGGSVDELEACARSADITALYALSEGEFVSYILGAPAFVTQPFRDLFADGLPLMTPLVAKSEGHGDR